MRVLLYGGFLLMCGGFLLMRGVCLLIRRVFLLMRGGFLLMPFSRCSLSSLRVGGGLPVHGILEASSKGRSGCFGGG